MSDTRKIQRTLFRMQCDPAFARRLLAGDAEAAATTGLDHGDLALLRALDPDCVAADPGGKRRTQVLGNVSSEHTATLAAAALEAESADLLAGFLGAPELHAALVEDGRLPLAFARYVELRARAWPAVHALATLEGAMVRLRRAAAPDGRAPLTRGDVRLSARAALVALPEGTLARAEALRAAVAAGRSAPRAPAPAADARELVLLVRPSDVAPHRLPELAVERLAPPADALLEAAREPLGAGERAAFARAHGAAPEDLEAFVDELVADGALERGGAGAS